MVGVPIGEFEIDIFHQKHHFKKGDIMKFNKIILILLTTAIILLFTGCFSTHKYIFLQDASNIVSVEIRALEYDPYYSQTPKKTTIIRSLNSDEATTLLRDISEAEFGEWWGDSLGQSCGDEVVYITYSDGVCEVIGDSNCAIIEKNGKWTFTEKYFCGEHVFDDVISKIWLE